MSIRRNASYNIAGALIPVVLALVTVPAYLKLIGAERYGVLAIAWLMLGYFGRLDLGLGRATSFRMAALRDAPPETRADAFWTALAVNSAMGLVGAVIFLGVGGYFFGYAFKVSEEVRAEVLLAVPLLAMSAPVATISGVLVGALEGRERFLLTNVVSTAANTLFQLGPLALAWLVGPNLVMLLAAALSSRVLALLALGLFCRQEIVAGRRPKVQRQEAVTLLKFGGWVNIVSIFGPLMVIVDRFAIGAIHGSVAVAIYTIPFQLAQRVAILPASLTNAAFPRMSAGTTIERDALAERTLRVMLGLVSVPILVGIYIMEPFLNIWIGPEVGAQSAPVGRILLLAFWLNAFALVPFVKLQASGRPDLVAKVVLAEIPLYLVALYLSLTYGGYEACAAVFAARCLADYLCMNWLSAGRIPNLLLQATALGLLLLGLYCAHIWPSISDWRWWTSCAVISLALAAVSWRSTPPDLQRRLAGLPIVRRVLPGARKPR